MWQQILTQLGGIGIAAASIAWLVKKIVVHWLDKDVSKYRSDLQAARDVELEKLRNELRIASIEHEIRFRSVYEKQALIIAKTYQKLSEMQRAIVYYTQFLVPAGGPTLEQKREEAVKRQAAFRDYFFPRAIFLPPQAAKLVREVSDKMVTLANVFTKLQQPGSDKRYEKLDEQFESIRASISPALDELDKEFRGLLGMKAESTSNQSNKSSESNGEENESK